MTTPKREMTTPKREMTTLIPPLSAPYLWTFKNPIVIIVIIDYYIGAFLAPKVIKFG